MVLCGKIGGSNHVCYVFLQDVLVITGGAWGSTPAAAALRKVAGVYAIGVRPKVQVKHLQQVTDNPQRNFLVGSYPELRNYWTNFRNNFVQGGSRLPMRIFLVVDFPVLYPTVLKVARIEQADGSLLIPSNLACTLF